jgi:TRAP-type C4-dicarboxylate transport system permease large subunit
MLNVMRKQAGSWMIKVILFAIVIVFVFWGVGSFRSQEANKVAVVNDEIISVAEYRRTYNNLLDQYRQRFGSSLNDGMIEMLNVKKQALDQLIDRTILLQEAKKLDLRVSDAEIAESIMKTAIFRTMALSTIAAIAASLPGSTSPRKSLRRIRKTCCWVRNSPGSSWVPQRCPKRKHASGMTGKTHQ